MKTLALLAITLAILTSCATTCNCPPEDIIIFTQSMEPVGIPAGELCDKENYMTPEQYNSMMEEIIEEYKRENSL